MPSEEEGGLTLGLDLGSNSIGWALLHVGRDRVGNIVGAGVRAFEAGLDDLEQDGKGESRNAARREARGRRRLLERQKRRLVIVAHRLQEAGLLPEGNMDESLARHEYFTGLDAALQASVYELRAGALERRLEPFELGRAIYHLAQRRGFKSNRVETAKSAEEEEKGVVKGGIADLREKMGGGTLGEYFAKLEPRLDGQRIRKRYTGRDMYEDEFSRIWETQRYHYPDLLSTKLRRAIHRAIFHQRPLKCQKRLIGSCELIPRFKRAPIALLSAQRFRYLQTVNNLQIEDHSTGEIRPLTEDERQKLLSEVEIKAEMKFSSVRKSLGLPKAIKFNLERGGEEAIAGNKTGARLSAIFGIDRWQKMSVEEKDAVVEDIRSIVNEKALRKRGQTRWDLNAEQAEKFGQVALESGYCSFSRQALAILLPQLEQGTRLQTVIKDKFPERFARAGEPVAELPPLRESGLTRLRNPIVERAVSELRRVVNAIIRRYGLPEAIHIELGRDLRQNAVQREKTIKKMRANQRARKAAVEKIFRDAGIANPSATDVLRVLLAEECNWICPYTGRQIGIGGLLGTTPEFDIEHIIPFNRCLDDSYLNKTLCEASYNRNVKRERTPYEAEGHNTERWDAILRRVKQFQGDAARAKLTRFKYEAADVAALLDRFTERQLNDTRWASKLAKQYLGLLYGGVDDDGVKGGKRRVQATSGGITGFVRREWGLNNILGREDTKSRDDHRHHAIDAIVISLTNHGMVKRLNDAASRISARHGYRLFDDFPQPWEGFHRQAEEVIKGTITSHRVDKRVRGALHNETFYGKPRKDRSGKSYVHARTHLSALKPDDIEDIVDPTVRSVIAKHLAEHRGDIKKAFADENSHPVMPVTGHRIHRVRLRMNLTCFPVGEGARVRYVQSSRNHHMEIVARKDNSGATIEWEGYVVSLYDAYRRRKENRPVVRRDFGDGQEFVMSIANGEVIELGALEGDRQLYVVRTVPLSRQVYFVPINDARPLKKIGRTGLTAMPDTLRVRRCSKVLVTPLGELRYSAAEPPP